MDTGEAKETAENPDRDALITVAAEPPKPATATPAAPRPTRVTPPADSSELDATPVMPSPPPSLAMPGSIPGLPPEKAPESLNAIPVSDLDPVALPVMRAAAIEKTGQPAQSPVLIRVLRTLEVRNIEIARKYTGRVEDASRRFVSSIVRMVTSTRIGGKPIRQVMRDAGRGLRAIPGKLLTWLQRRLEASDAAVIAVTLFLIVICVLLTLFAVYLSNRF